MRFSRLSPRLASLLVLMTVLALGLLGCDDLFQHAWAECRGNVATTNTYYESGWELEEVDCDETEVPSTCQAADDDAWCEVPAVVPAPSAARALAWSDGVVSIAADSADLEIDGRRVARSGEHVPAGYLEHDGSEYVFWIHWADQPELKADLVFSFTADGGAWVLERSEVHIQTPTGAHSVPLSGLNSDTGPRVHASFGVWWRGDLTLETYDHTRLTLKNAHFRAFE
jgi:hypothetical protein